MRRVRASSGRRVAAVAADVTAVADTVVGGVTVVVAASEEAATSQPALPADRCCRVRCLRGFALSAYLICAEDSARYSRIGKIWAGLDSNQRRRKASRFTVCPVWPLRYLPFLARGISYILALHSLQLALAFPAVDSANVTDTF